MIESKPTCEPVIRHESSMRFPLTAIALLVLICLLVLNFRLFAGATGGAYSFASLLSAAVAGLSARVFRFSFTD